MNRLSRMVVDFMEIESEDREVYEYGVMIMLKKALFYLFIFSSLAVMGRVAEGLCLLVPFAFLRRNAGGLHCKTFLGCFLLSLASILGSVLLIRYHMLGIVYYRFLTVGSELILFLVKPVDCENKRVEQSEKEIFYKQEIAVIFLIDLVLVVLAIIGPADWEKAMESAVILVGVTSLIAVISGQ